jgi:type IV secretory pathway VirB10-like protein
VSKGQRLGFLAIAVAIAIVAVIISSSSGGDDEQERATATATPTAEETTDGQQEASPVEPEPTPTPKPKPPLLTAGEETTLEFEEGDRVAFRVRHDAPEHVHVHGYDIFKDLEPNKTVTISFKADIVGIFEIELEDSAVPLAQLKVEP